MRRPVTFHRLANLELQEASAYYASVGEALGSEFLDEVERVTLLLAEHPELGPTARGAVRQRSLRRFPYTVFYSTTGAAIRILAIGHQKRRPFYWARRR